MNLPTQENLVAVDQTGETEQPTEVTQAPEKKPETPGQEPESQPQLPEAKETELPFYNGDAVTNAAREDMFKLTGEDPTAEIAPQTPDSEKDPEPEPKTTTQPQQTETDPGQQPQPKKIMAAGKEFTVDQLAESYTQLNREFHKKNNDHISEIRKLQLKTLEVTNENEQRRAMIESAVFQNQNGTNGKNDNSPKPTINQEDFDKMVEDGKTVDAIGQIVRANMQDAQKTQESKFKEEQQTAEKTAKKDRQVSNLQTMDSELKSFSENRQSFAQWAEDQLGDDKVGLAAIANIAEDLPRLKKFYGNFLKSTYDFSQKISEATHKGQTMAEVKQSLQPVSSGAQAAPRQNSGVQANQPTLEPVDQDLVDMEGHLGTARMRPSFFSKR